MHNSLANLNVSISAGLCFKEEEFLDPNFNVDKFVSKYKDLFPLSTLREDLETHYKNIQLALVELINRDYADFVSLSSNLIGTDKTIESLKEPLLEIKSKIAVVRDDVSNVLQSLKEKLEKRKLVREKKLYLKHLMNLVHSVEKIEKILAADLKSPDAEILFNQERTQPGHYLERIAGEYNQLQFHVNQTKGHPIIELIRPRVSLITSKLQEALEDSFQLGIENRQTDIIRRSLRTYALIDKISYAEDLFRNILVKPYIISVVNEDYFNEHGIETMCIDILKFIKQSCSIVLNLSAGELYDADQQEQHSINSFDFLVNSIWVEIEKAFEENLPLLFSPGNPEIFIKRYRVMMGFLDEFEKCCVPSSFYNLRNHTTYHSFMNKWSLPVYFQIRFQEIGGQVESAVDNPYDKSPHDLFISNIVGTAWKCICQCWNDEVFISVLKGRFWKLTMQILCRLGVFLQNLITSENSSLENLCTLLGDVNCIILKIKEYFTEVILKKILEDGPLDATIYQDAINESCEFLSTQLTSLSNQLVSLLTHQINLQLDSVKNVPRLYRRTNKEPPSEPSKYVLNAMIPLNKFASNATMLSENQRYGILSSSLGNLSERYYTLVDELLTAIRKTEDSLLRLKQQRKAASGQSEVNQLVNNSEVSDENKIRKQLLLDSEAFDHHMSILGFTGESFPAYLKLMNVVRSALTPE